ncbi:MAG: hypothetical protein IJY42_06305 [Clostridia bacterium]|nr:hypothetical protein [Clostridia bacterium]
MGKSNRIRINRANTKMSAPVAKKSQGIPGWALTLITILVAVAVVMGVAAGIMSNNGTFTRLSTYAKTEHHRVSGTMAAYFFYTTYSEFTSDLEEEDMTAMGLSTGTSLKSQTYKGDEEFEGTWFDYFAQKTKEALTKTLVYCEKATENGLTLDEDDEKTIEQSFSTLDLYASIYQYSRADMIRMQYGAGVNESDVRKAMRLQALANKYIEFATEKLNAELDANAQQITDRYEANRKDYDVIDYLYYNYTVSLEDVIAEVLGTSEYTDAQVEERKTDILNAYMAKIAEAKSKAETLITADEATFKETVVNDLITKYYAAALLEAEIDEADVPTDTAVVDAIKEGIVAQIRADILDGKATSTLTATVEGEGDAKTHKLFDKVVAEAYATAMSKLYTTVYEDVYADSLIYFRKEVGYVEKDTFSEWVFSADRTEKTHTIFTGDKDVTAESTISSLTKSYSARGYLVTAEPYKLTNLTKDVAYMTFTTKEEAQLAADALKAHSGAMTYDVFASVYESVAVDKTTSYCEKVTDFAKGDMNSDTFDEWVYADERKAGDFTTEPLVLTEGSAYALLFVEADGYEEWYVDVRADITSERMESDLTTFKTQVAITWNDKVLGKLAA